MQVKICAACVFVSLSLIVSPVNGQTLFAVDSSRAFYSVDMNTGAKTLLCTVSSNAGTTGGLAYDRFNDIMYLTSTSNDSLYTLNTTTCAATLVGPYGDSTLVMHGLEYDLSTGDLYGGSNGNLYKINKTNGAAAIVGISGLTSFLNLGYNSDTDVLYASSSGSDSFYTISRSTGAVTLIGPLVNSGNPNGMAYDYNNDIMFMVDNTADMLFKMNLATGEAVSIGSTGSGNLLGLAYVPEPATMGLLVIGGAIALRRRK